MEDKMPEKVVPVVPEVTATPEECPICKDPSRVCLEHQAPAEENK